MAAANNGSQDAKPEELAMHDTYILSEYLPLYPNVKPLYKVTVTNDYISWEPTKKEKRGSIKARKHSLKGKRSSSKLSISDDTDCGKLRQSVIHRGGLFISMEDITGCDCMKGKESSDPSVYLTLYAYPHKKKVASRKTVRKRETLTLIFNNCNTYDDNMKEAQKWNKVIRCLVKGINISHIDDVSNVIVPTQKQMFVLINPFGGQGKALQLFQQRIVPLLAEACITYEMKVTEYAGHAKEIVKDLDIKLWNGILIVSGDGLIHEVINGLMERPDWKQAIKMPLGILPAGSGNALCCAISYQTGEPYLNNHLLHATFTISKHSTVPMDLVAIDTFLGSRLYSFLSCCWGLMADVDIESEKYRKLGNARFTVGALVRIMNLRRYRGRVSYLPYEGSTQRCYEQTRSTNCNEDNNPLSGDTIKHANSTTESYDCTLGDADSRTLSTAENGLDGGMEEVNGVADQLERVELNDNSESNGLDNQPAKTSGDDGVTVNPVPTPFLVPLHKPVPPGWVTIEGEFINVAAIYLSHLAKDMIAAPNSKLADGLIYLTITRAGISRMKLIQLLTAIQEGTYTGTPDSELIKVKAFRFEPDEKDGIMTCDGERIEYGPIQGQVLPSVASIMSLKKCTSATL